MDFIYARQSVEREDSISVESQIELCEKEVTSPEYMKFSDKGYSGKNTDRPDFKRMMDRIRAGDTTRVIVYRLDRISRSVLDFAELINEFQKYGVEFVSVTERFDTSTPIGKAMLMIVMIFAQLERETIQQRVVDAYRSRSRKGFYMGGRMPYGFQLKVQNKSQFFTEEVLILCDLLEIKTWKEREAIFFKRNDDLKSSKVS